MSPKRNFSLVLGTFLLVVKKVLLIRENVVHSSTIWKRFNESVTEFSDRQT